jgi:sulfatase modifying factor 1
MKNQSSPASFPQAKSSLLNSVLQRSRRVLFLFAILTGCTAREDGDTKAHSGMVLIPSGTFLMGRSPGKPVQVDAFSIEKCEVTGALWELVYAWATNNGYSFANPGSASSTNHPVHTVNFYDAVKWCNARSQKEGLPPVYYTSAEQTNIYRTGARDLSPDCVRWKATGYRLPTEEEWEKAARGGLVGKRFPWGDDPNKTASGKLPVDWRIDWPAEGTNKMIFAKSIDPKRPLRAYHLDGALTTPVGSFEANGYGLYDMAGNVREFCWHKPRYAGLGPCMTRGGGWMSIPAEMECAHASYDPRTADSPSSSLRTVGFRCVRTAHEF